MIEFAEGELQSQHGQHVFLVWSTNNYVGSAGDTQTCERQNQLAINLEACRSGNIF